MKKSQKTSVILPSVLAILTTTTSVNALSEEQNQSKLAEMIVSASRIEQPIEQSGSSVIVLYADELEAQGIHHTADALRQIPSLNVSSFGPRGSMTQLRMRGNEANHVLILLDGVRVSNASSGEFDLANLPLNGIEKIEVLMGPQSTLYGSDAAAGVINITTLKGNNDYQGKIHASLGTEKSRALSLAVSGEKIGWHYAVSGQTDRTDGISAAKVNYQDQDLENDAYSNKTLNLKTGYRHEKFESWIQYHYAAAQYDYDDENYTTGLASDNPNNIQWSDLNSFAIGIKVPLLDGKWKNQLMFARADNDYKSSAMDVTNYGGSSKYQSQTDRDSLEYQSSYQLNTINTIQFGFEHISEGLATQYASDYGLTIFDDDIRMDGVYAQWISKINKLDITFGARNDNHQQYGDHQTYRLTANYPLNPQWRFIASYGTGFKAPSLLDLFNTDFGANPHLNPEETKAAEMGLQYQYNGYEFKVTVFDQHTANLIRWIPDTENSWTGKLINVDEADSRGVETSFAAFWGDFEIDFSATWLDAIEKKNNRKAKRLRVPEWSASSMIKYNLDKLGFWSQIQFRDQRRDQNFATGSDVQLNSYWLINAGINYQYTDNLSFMLSIENLFDKEYEEVYSYATRGFGATAAVNWYF